MDNMKITKNKLGGTEMEHPSFGTLMFNRAHCGGKLLYSEAALCIMT